MDDCTLSRSSTSPSISEVVRAFLQGKHSRSKLIDFYNDYLAEPFIESEEGEGITEDVLYDRREDYGPEGSSWTVPMAAMVITCFVDVQKNRLETEAVAWGEGQESWGLEYRQIPGNPSMPRWKWSLVARIDHLAFTASRIRLCTVFVT